MMPLPQTLPSRYKMEASSLSVAVFLRTRRQQRRWTQAQVAQRAGVVKSTVSKWESGNVLPRLPELLRVLTVLEVSEHEQAALLQQMGRIWQAVPHHSPVSVSPSSSAPLSIIQTMPHSFPLHGDLLRAMRYRVGLSQQEAAHRAKIAQGTLAKWEGGSDWPRAERLQGLGYVLSATAEEIAVLTSGVFTYFPTGHGITDETDLVTTEEEIHQLFFRSYYYPFAPHDLWFMSLLARLGPISMRGDTLGRTTLLLWARTAYLYQYWLGMCRRLDLRRIHQQFLERVESQLSTSTDYRLWQVYAWSRMHEAVCTGRRLRNGRATFLRGRHQGTQVSPKVVRTARGVMEQWSAIARRVKSPSSATLANAATLQLYYALLFALNGDSDTAARLDDRAAAEAEAYRPGWSTLTDVALFRADLPYLRGDAYRALEQLPEIPPPATDTDEAPFLSPMLRLDLLRVRIRALLDTGTPAYVEEGRYLLDVFNREVAKIPLEPLRTYLGPLVPPVE